MPYLLNTSETMNTCSPMWSGGRFGQENPVAFMLDIKKQKQLTTGHHQFRTFIHSYSHWNCHIQKI